MDNERGVVFLLFLFRKELFEMFECMVYDVFDVFECCFVGINKGLAIEYKVEGTFVFFLLIFYDFVVYPNFCCIVFGINFFEIWIHFPVQIFFYELFDGLLFVCRYVSKLVRNNWFLCHDRPGYEIKIHILRW